MLINALIAAVLGFGVLVGLPAWVAKVVFVVGLILFIICFLTAASRWR